MEYHLAVHYVHACQKIPHHGLDLFNSYWFRFLHEVLAQSGTTVLKHTMNHLFGIMLVFNHVQNLHELWVVTQTLEQRNLPHRRIVDPVLHILHILFIRA